MSESNRREFLQGATATLMGVGAAGSALAGERVPKPLELAMPELLDQERLLLDAAWLEPAATMVSGMPGSQFTGQALATALWVGHYRSADAEELESERFQEELADRAEGMADTVYTAALEFDSLSDGDFSDLDERIAANPEVLEETRLRFYELAAREGLPKKVIRKFERAHRELRWRLRKQGSAAISRELVGKLDRAAVRQGEDWRSFAREGATKTFCRKGSGVQYRRESAAQMWEQKARRRRRTALILLGISGGILTTSIAIDLAAGSGGVVTLFAATPAIILLILATIYGILSLSARARARSARR